MVHDELSHVWHHLAEGVNHLVFRYALFDNDEDGIVASNGS
jgi:hypothetical protein